MFANISKTGKFCGNSIRMLFSNGQVVNKNPWYILNDWRKEASKICDEKIMYLSTVSKSLAPSCRITTCLDISKENFKFSVNKGSQTEIDLNQNKSIALTFFWPSNRVVRIEGSVVKLPENEKHTYILNLPYNERVRAKCYESRKFYQNRQDLIKFVNEMKLTHASNLNPDLEICVAIPNRIEFYQSMKGKMQERLQFNKVTENTKIDNKFIYEAECGWTYSILSP